MREKSEVLDIDKAQRTLLAMQAELTARLRRLEEALAQPLDPDSGERAVEMEDDASLERQALLVADEMASVDRALERIAHGTFGTCVRCGGDIGAARLQARPEAARCMDCAGLS